MTFPAEAAEEVVATAGDVLRASQHRIEDGMVDGIPWPAYCYQRSADITRRLRVSRRRRSA